MGEPVVRKDCRHYIPVAAPSVGDAEVREVEHALRSGRLSGGEKVERFEYEFAESHGLPSGVSCNSGTTALHLALVAAGIKPGDRVAVPTLTMVACGNAILYCGAVPVFVDSEPETGNWDREAAYKLDDLAAAMPVHLYGVPCEYKFGGLKFNIIEDCAEAHYARYPLGNPVGMFARMACFSFYANKIIGTGEGGMVLCGTVEDRERLRSLRAHAFTPGEHFHHQGLAFGYRMTELQAAVGLAQHRRRDELLSRREEIAGMYDELLRDWIDWHYGPLGRPLVRPARTVGSAWWVYPLLVARDFRWSRDSVRQALAEDGVETRSYFRPLHRQPHLERFAIGKYPIADDLSNRGFYLPLYPTLSDRQVKYVCDRLKAFLDKRAV